MAEAKICAVEGCGKPTYCRGWCPKHYFRWKKNGDPLIGGWDRIAVCTEEGCGKKAFARGLCSWHYKTAAFRERCSVDGCDKPSHSRGLCIMHGKRLRKNGSIHVKKRPAAGEVAAWINAHLDFDGEECLIWPFSRDQYGYGKSRRMCEEAHGAPPSKDHHAAHSCGQGHNGCVHPKHLRWATRKENQQEMVDHGNSLRGEKNPSTSLSEDDVREIRRLCKGLPQALVASQFSVSQGAVSRIARRETWGWLE